MSIKEVTMYTVCCDRCGKSADDGTEYAGWSDKNGAIDVAMNSDFFDSVGDHICEHGSHYCPDCWYWDEDDNFCITIPEGNL